MAAAGAAPPDFRLAEETNIAALHQLIESAYRGDSARQGWTHESDLLGGQRTDPEALHEIINDPGQVILLAMRQGRLIGCVQLSKVGAGMAYLGMLTVDPALQTAGLGKAIMQEAERFVSAEWGVAAMEMTVIRQREELIAWYERRGYRRTGETRPFPTEDPRFGLPKTDALAFVVLTKEL